MSKKGYGIDITLCLEKTDDSSYDIDEILTKLQNGEYQVDYYGPIHKGNNVVVLKPKEKVAAPTCTKTCKNAANCTKV